MSLPVIFDAIPQSLPLNAKNTVSLETQREKERKSNLKLYCRCQKRVPGEF